MRLGRARISLAAVVAAGGVGLSPSNAHAAVAQAWGLGSSSTPGIVTGLGSGVTAVAAGSSSSHSLAIVGGAARAWGSNTGGQLGDGSTTNSGAPVDVFGLNSNVTAISAGNVHSLAIHDGAAKAWGSGSLGQLGNGATSNSSVPVDVFGLDSNVTAISAGSLHSLAIQNGAAKAWGIGSTGRLGNGQTSGTFTTPVDVTGLSSNVTAVAAGSSHNLAIQSGAAKAFGQNSFGQLGDNSFATRSTPVDVIGLTSGVTAIAAGTTHSLAVKDGNVYAWGNDSTFGSLGNGASQGNSSVPVMVLDRPANFTAVAAGDASSYALSADGTLWVWGRNNDGQLGLGNTTSQQSPVQRLAPAGYRYTSISAGAQSRNALATLATRPISLTAAAPTDFGSQVGTLAVTGGSGNYVFTSVTFAGASTGYVAVSGFNPVTDMQVYALDITGSDAASFAANLATLVAAINAGVDNGYTLTASTTSPSGAAGPYDLFVTVADNTLGSPQLGFDFANVDGLIGTLSVTSVAVVPEPASLSLIALTAAALLRRRRRGA